MEDMSLDSLPVERPALEDAILGGVILAAAATVVVATVVAMLLA